MDTTTHRRRPRTGLDQVLENPALLPAGPLALCANYTSVTPGLTRGVDALLEAGIPLTALLTPEHGYWGAAQAGESDGDSTDDATGLPILDTYRTSGPALDALLRRTGARHVLVDLQDIGTRFYTYMWTLYDLMASGARTGIGVVVLDRPNPLGRATRGPGLDPACASFIGRADIPLQHGLTLGELARWFAAEHIPAATGSAPALQVIETHGWDGDAAGPDDPWIMPSPNMPTRDTAALYPATGLLEGTLASEGRGTTRPFELIGAPWTDARFAGALRERTLPGLLVREAVFTPVFSKGAGQRIHGAQLHLIDAGALDPIATGHAILATLRALHPTQPLWREAEGDRPPFLDLLWGSPALREGIDDDAALPEILAASPPTPTPPAPSAPRKDAS
ncbi:MAG: DUF1343 domain-containing protein [Brachybacterium sp.]|nr:DUF1343 domain-containing protein [Brachybacterium sp.]